MSKNSTNSFISLIIGLIVGGIIGILFAPDKGNNTRDRLNSVSYTHLTLPTKA